LSRGSEDGSTARKNQGRDAFLRIEETVSLAPILDNTIRSIRTDRIAEDDAISNPDARASGDRDFTFTLLFFFLSLSRSRLSRKRKRRRGRSVLTVSRSTGGGFRCFANLDSFSISRLLPRSSSIWKNSPDSFECAGDLSATRGESCNEKN
jgi:hypothetical protein